MVKQLMTYLQLGNSFTYY